MDHMQDFGSRLGDFQEAEEPAMDLENLKSDRFEFLRQTDTGVTEAPEESDDDEIRCIQKVMQVMLYKIHSECKKLFKKNENSGKHSQL